MGVPYLGYAQIGTYSCIFVNYNSVVLVIAHLRAKEFVMELVETTESLEEYYQRHRNYLNPEIGNLWVEGLLAWKDLPEVVYGLDHLEEIVDTEYFKHNRILQTGDIRACGNEAVRIFNLSKLHKQDHSWKVKNVGLSTWDAMEEFFKLDYVSAFFKLMKAVRNNRLALTKDGNPYIVRLEVNTPHPLFAIFEYTNVNEKKVLKMPFFLNRLGKNVQAGNYYPKPILQKIG